LDDHCLMVTTGSADQDLPRGVHSYLFKYYMLTTMISQTPGTQKRPPTRNGGGSTKIHEKATKNSRKSDHECSGRPKNRHIAIGITHIHNPMITFGPPTLKPRNGLGVYKQAGYSIVVRAEDP